MTFDTWEIGIHPELYLAHHGIKGMKHGRNRYQTESGEWTEEGLERRRKREGFGESRKERKLKKKIEKAEKHEARKAAREEARAAYAERQRKKKLSGLTDDELKEKINRAKMEQEYRELKRSPMIKTGTEILGKILEYKENRERRVSEMNKQKLEMARLKVQELQAKTQRVQAEEATKQSKNQIKISRNEAEKVGHEAKKVQADVKGGLKLQRKAQLKNAKTAYRATTFRGALALGSNNRTKWRQAKRMDPYEEKKHQRNLQMGVVQYLRDTTKKKS